MRPCEMWRHSMATNRNGRARCALLAIGRITVHQCELARCNAKEPEEFYSDGVGAPKFVDATDIIDACMWAEKRHGVIKVVAPFGVRAL